MALPALGKSAARRFFSLRGPSGQNLLSGGVYLAKLKTRGKGRGSKWQQGPCLHGSSQRQRSRDRLPPSAVLLLSYVGRSPGEEMAGLKSPDRVYPESECQVPLVGLTLCSEGNFLQHRVLRVF